MIRNNNMMLEQIMQLSFKLYDLKLFLDTHPTENSAIEEYNTTLNKYKSMVNHYEKLYGPLSALDVDENQQEWDWIKGPWPWENCKIKEDEK
ncbi:MAG: spore coat protein CotJB [Clostridia bacterium]|nr:spore coat protein CotJB [Clostridia bacterium]